MKVQPKARAARDKPKAAQQFSQLFYLTDSAHFDTLECRGYTTLAHSPEVSTAVDTIARLIGAMTIQLLRNTEAGDVRVKDAISRVVDIEPNRFMTRSNLLQWIVRTLYLEGRGNAIVLPRTERAQLRELRPVPAAYVSLVEDGLFDYEVYIAGRRYDPGNLLHFVLNPGSFYPWRGEGFTLTLADVANNLKQAAATEKGFMSSKWKPSIIIRVDGFFDELATEEGRDRLLDKYVNVSDAGKPWLLPAGQMDVQQVKPLTLSDLALADFVKLDKRTVAAILGVPPFVLGVGDFKREEWNNFVSTTIMPLAHTIEQELTRKLLTDPDLFFRFNPRSLMNYSMDELIRAGAEMVDRSAMRRNEWRDWLGLPPDEEMNDLLILENYLRPNRLESGAT